MELIRNHQTWLASLGESHCHQLFAVHGSGEYVIASTLAGELLLLLLRVLQGLWRDACDGVVACMAFGVPIERDECLLWEEIVATLGKDSCIDAAVARDTRAAAARQPSVHTIMAAVLLDSPLVRCHCTLTLSQHAC